MYEKACKKCGNCCRFLPCPVFPKDLKRFSQLFHLPIKKLIEKYFIWNKHCTDPKNYILFPKKHGDLGIESDKSWSHEHGRVCMFFDVENNLCKIHKNKPTGGAMLICKENKPKRLKHHKDGRKIMRRAVESWRYHPLNPKYDKLLSIKKKRILEAYC